MKIIVFQQNKKILITFQQGDTVDNYSVNKAEKFLVCIDKFLKKHHTLKIRFKIHDLRFKNVSLLTERIVRATMVGLCFDSE